MKHIDVDNGSNDKLYKVISVKDIEDLGSNYKKLC